MEEVGKADMVEICSQAIQYGWTYWWESSDEVGMIGPIGGTAEMVEMLRWLAS
jgi:hypothetical protein